MWLTILKLIINFAGSEVGKEAIKLGSKKLVESTDNGIDNEILEVFLGDAVKSKKNKLTDTLVSEMIKRVS